MRKIQKVLLGVFAAGVLLSGIGTGIAFVEYSTLAYGGHKMIGEENLVTKTYVYELKDLSDRIQILDDFDYYSSRVTTLVEDSTVPEKEIQYQVTYNEKRVRPYIWSHESVDHGNEESLLQIGLEMEYERNEFEEFMEVKDAVLNELKQNAISSYEIIYVTDVVIKVHPETMKMMKVM